MSLQDRLQAASGPRRLYLLLTSHPALRRFWRIALWSFWLVYFGFIALVLALRYSILPNIEQHRPAIEQIVSRGLGQTVNIGRIEASWEGINPDLTLHDVSILDAAGRPALAFSRVEAILSWWSVPSAKLKLRLLRIVEPTLNLRRDPQGRFFVAGLPLNGNEGGGDVSDWILAQRKIRIQDATLVWEDELRQAPVLRLESLNFGLDSFGRHHRFGLTAIPPGELASRIDVRGDFRGADLDLLEDWAGTAFAEIDYIDLAAWRKWIDYPVALPHGRGALRSWVGFSHGALREITADFSLSDVSMRLAREIPSLDLTSMSGRIVANLSKSGFVVKGRGIELETRPVPRRKGAPEPGIRIEPTDFHVEWQPQEGGQEGAQEVAGSASATRLDLAALGRLAERLPLDGQTRRLLVDYAPRGLVSGLNVRWKGNAERLQSYGLKAEFERMALNAQGYFPGFSGISGSLEATEIGGSVNLAAQQSGIDLPSVFPVSLIELDSLKAQANWRIGKDGVEVDLARMEFAGPEAAGSAKGVYRLSGNGPGEIDLTAALTRADARAVWRYMPHVVGEGARHWLRDSLIAGKASEAKLTLKGDLSDFPFLDKRKGEFLVTVKAQDVVLDYANGWPRIEGIRGDLRFEGNGMLVDAHEGTILGAKLSRTRAEIPDLEAPISTLLVKGKAEGTTAEFLRFIEQSPVAERIDHFTEDMRAVGNGHLDLSLKIPLDERKLGDSRIEGIYRFLNNEVLVDSALPPLRQVNGTVQFSGSDLRVPEINANLFGGPLKIKGGLQKDGRVVIVANGTVNVEQMRKQGDSALLSRLSGSAGYHGEVQINKRNADFVLETSLVGLASTLPAPFAKAAGDALPLHFEKRLLAAATPGKGERPPKSEAVHDQLSASLGSVLSAKLIRRKQKDGFVVERGAIGIGRTQNLPESGVVIGVTGRTIDADEWRSFFAASSPAGGDSASSPASAVLNLQAQDLKLFGRHLHDVDMDARSSTGQWRVRVKSQQADGEVLWDGAGRGKLTARLKRLAIDAADEPDAPEGKESEDAVHELPALDIVAEEFRLGGRQFGHLDLQARNEGGVWKLNRIQMNSPFGTISGNGRWLASGGRNQTQLDFKLESADVGRMLERMGYPGAIRGATAKLDGQVGWKGSPVGFDFASLNGDMSLEAARGQFVKLDPGAGKLIGLISLQSLPRRIALDFRDVFSEGFAFDTITAKLNVQNGVMRTDRLLIEGTSARIAMRGEVDLKRETQRLSVNVQPEVGSTAALGIAIAHPVVGVATLLAHKVLQNPLNQMFGFDYQVTGTWGDPKVERISRGGPSDSGPRLPNVVNPGVIDESSTK